MTTKFEVPKLVQDWSPEQLAAVQAAMTARVEELAHIEAEKAEQDKVSDWIKNLTEGLVDGNFVTIPTVTDFVIQSLKEIAPKKVRGKNSTNGDSPHFHTKNVGDVKPGSATDKALKLFQGYASPVTVKDFQDNAAKLVLRADYSNEGTYNGAYIHIRYEAKKIAERYFPANVKCEGGKYSWITEVTE